MAYEDDNITKEDDVVSDDEEQHNSNRPESPRTTAARYLLDLANFGAKDVHNTQQIELSVNTSWGHDKGQAYIEECGLPFTPEQLLVSCQTLTDLNNFLAEYNLTEEQTALCHAAYQMGKGNGSYSNSPTDDAISAGWNHHNLIHVLDHSYASTTNILQIATNAICSSINEEEVSSNSEDGGASSSGGSNMMECDSSLSRKTSWDERNYKRYGLPFSYAKIVDSPMDEFNELMNNGNLTEKQVTLCRNTRRRGKNKVAAQNCRRRKLGLISRLKDELDATRRTRTQLMDDRKKLNQECAEWATKVSDIKTRVLKGLGKSPRKYCIEVINQKVAIGLRCDVVVKKRNMSIGHGDTVLSPLQMSERFTWNEPQNTLPPQKHLNSIKVEIKKENELSSETNNYVQSNNIDHEDKQYQMSFVNPEYIKQEEIALSSHIKEEIVD